MVASVLQDPHHYGFPFHTLGVIPEISLLDWMSDHSMQVLRKEFQIGDGKCNVRVPNADTDDCIVITGVYQPGFDSMYGSPKNTMTTIYFCCYSAKGEILGVDNPIRRLMRHLAHQALDQIYQKKE